MIKKILALVLFAASFAAAASDLDQQIQFWEKRLARDPDDFISPTKLGELFLQQARETGNPAANVEAEKNLRLALKRNPEHHAAIVLLASTCIAQHKFFEARNFAEKAVKIKPDDAFSSAVLGDACLESGDISCAESSYKKIVESTPALATHSRMANLQWLKGNPHAAFDSYVSAIKAGEMDSAPALDLAWCHLQKGELHFRLGQFDPAQKEYEAAAKLSPDHFAVVEHLAELQAAKSNFVGSLSLYQKVISHAPRPELLQTLGEVYDFMGKPNEAKPWFEFALTNYLQSAEAGDPRYYHHLASFYCDIQRQPKEALKWARKDYEQRQTIFTADALASALYQHREWDEAYVMAKKALALGTKDPHLLFHAGRISLMAGKESEGKELLQKVTAINPQFNNTFHTHR